MSFIDEVKPMTWFGASWGGPINEFCKHQETPVGELCLRCEEAIEWWASGVVQSCFLQSDPRRRIPQHLECFIRGTVGSVGHLLARCSCHGGDEDDPPGLTIREAARAAMLTFLEVWES